LRQQAAESLREAAKSLGLSVVDNTKGRSRRRPASVPQAAGSPSAPTPGATPAAEAGRVEAWLRAVLANGPMPEAELRERFARDKVGQRLRVKTYLQTGVLKLDPSSRKICLA